MDSAVIGAFFTGVGAVISSGVALWLARRRADQECEKRMAAFKEGLDRGERR
jgi:energy-converting hydrogenase Eha subunit G